MTAHIPEFKLISDHAYRAVTDRAYRGQDGAVKCLQNSRCAKPEFPEGGYRSKTWEEIKNFLVSTSTPAAIFANTNDASVSAIDKALRVQKAFQQVLDHPEAAEALKHPALKPLLDEAAD